MLKNTLKRIWRNVWSHKFLVLTILLGYITIYLGGKCTSQKQEIDHQKQEALIYKAKLDAVSALFKPTATACPKIESLKCPLQAQPASASYRLPAPREAAPVVVNGDSDDDALVEAAEAALKVKEDALKADLSSQEVPQANSVINRRDQKDRITPPPPALKGNGSRVRVIKVKIPSWVN